MIPPKYSAFIVVSIWTDFESQKVILQVITLRTYLESFQEYSQEG